MDKIIITGTILLSLMGFAVAIWSIIKTRREAQEKTREKLKEIYKGSEVKNFQSEIMGVPYSDKEIKICPECFHPFPKGKMYCPRCDPTLKELRNR